MDINEYSAALRELTRLMRDDPEPDSVDGLRLQQLVTEIEAYEAIHYPIESGTPNANQDPMEDA